MPRSSLDHANTNHHLWTLLTVAYISIHTYVQTRLLAYVYLDSHVSRCMYTHIYGYVYIRLYIRLIFVSSSVWLHHHSDSIDTDWLVLSFSLSLFFFSFFRFYFFTFGRRSVSLALVDRCLDMWWLKYILICACLVNARVSPLLCMYVFVSLRRDDP